jgi:FtsP/CotA-like multicopper oxidase with cupredoxin domain
VNRAKTIIVAVIAWIATLFLPVRADALEVWLIAGPTEKTMPDGTPDGTIVPMWGFALDASGSFDDGIAPAGGAYLVPGPALTVLPDDDVLTIHLANLLPLINGEVAPVSIVIPGLRTAMSPVFQPNGRVRSFAAEALPNAPVTYTYSSVTPGTYLYLSGTHQAVQVQMGLYGAVTKNAGVGEAYPGIPYDNEVTLLYSEIDPALHTAVAGGTYGPGTSMPSTVNYSPVHFLVNGAPYTNGQAPIPIGAPGELTLIRFLNAGLRTHVPVVGNGHLSSVAEDGKLYPYPRRQYSVDLAAQKTTDAILSNPAPGVIAIYDRRLALTNAGSSPGGLLTRLQVTADPNAPVAVNDPPINALTTDEDTAVNVNVIANDMPAPGTTIDTDSIQISSGPHHGTAVIQPGGGLLYTPDPDYFGSDLLTYTVRSSTGALSNEALVSIIINPVSDPPVAVPDVYSATAEQLLTVLAPGVLVNDFDVDGDVLSVQLETDTTAGTLTLNADGSFSYEPNQGTTTDSFSYSISDGVFPPSIATVTIQVTSPPNTAPTAVDDVATTPRNTPVTIHVLANDSDPDGSLNSATVTVVSGPSKVGSTAVASSTGTITYTPKQKFQGTDVFTYQVPDDDGALSNVATVTVNVVKP